MRIRSVKPSFMKHEALQDLEIENPGKYIMLTFQGLWMLSDSKGKFEYKPRLMKLDILPFIQYDLQNTLDILETSGFFKSYTVNDKKYGVIPTFLEHQRISGKEKMEGEKYPDPILVVLEYKQGNNREAPETQPEAQEKEEELGRGKGNRKGKGVSADEKSSGVFSECKKFFLELYEEKERTSYYFTAKDAGKLTALIKKIGFKVQEKNSGKKEDDEVVRGFKVFVEQAHINSENWIKQNFSLTTLDSKFNEIFTQLINNRSQNKLVQIAKTFDSIIYPENSI